MKKCKHLNIKSYGRGDWRDGYYTGKRKSIEWLDFLYKDIWWVCKDCGKVFKDKPND